MKKKIIATMLTLALLVSIFPSSAFAYDNSVEDYHNDTDINSVLETAVEENVDVVENVNETKDDFEVTADDISIITPKDGGETIDTVLEDGDVIGLSFPSEVDTGKGEIENGTVAYSTDEDVDVYSQVEAEQVEGETLLFNRMMFRIESCQAPKEYTLNFDLPQGYYIESEKDYNEQEKERLLSQKEELLAEGMSESAFSALIEQLDINHDEIYIIDEENQVRQVVEKPWAKDADGNDLDTYFSINGNAVVQTVDFDNTTAFPVIADPKVGTTKRFSYKISNEAMGVPGFVAGTPLTSSAKNKARKLVIKKLGATAGSKFVPGLNIALWFVAGLALINGCTGKKGIKVYGTLIYQRKYIHKEGYYISGWGIKTLKVSRY